MDNNAKKGRSRLRYKNTSVKIFKSTDQANNMDVTDVMVEIYPLRHANLTPDLPYEQWRSQGYNFGGGQNASAEGASHLSGVQGHASPGNFEI